MRTPHAAFTLIELLVAMAVLAILAGMVLAVVPMIRRGIVAARAKTVLTTVHGAIETAGDVRPVPHPLAGSAEPRSLFHRADGSGAVASTGEALLAERLDWVATGSRQRVLLPHDRFAGRSEVGDVPALFGLPRWRLQVLGDAGELIVRHRRLPRLTPAFDANGDGVLDPPYTNANRLYPDARHLESGGIRFRITAPGSGYVQPPTLTISGGTGIVAQAIIASGQVASVQLLSSGSTPPSSAPLVTVTAAAGDPGSGAAIEAELHSDSDVRATLERILGSTRGPLADLAAIFTTDSGTTLADGLLWDAGQAPDPARWSHGCIRIASTWRRYRLRGAGLYDPWGTEILVGLDPANGSLRLESAGPDGLFLWKPDAAGGYSLADLAGDPPPERDASRDNLVIAFERKP